MFHREEFVYVEKFYKHLMKYFKEFELEDNWSDFVQNYEYDVENYCTYNLISVCHKLLEGEYFNEKRTIYFCNY